MVAALDAVRFALLCGVVGLLACGTHRAAERPPVAAPSEECAFTPAAVAPGASDVEQVAVAYADVKKAIESRAYCALPALVDAETLRVYEVLRQQALHAPREQVEQQPVLERTLILEMRTRLAGRLDRITGADVLAAGIDPPPRLFDVLVANVELGDVRVTGSVATAATSLKGVESPRRYRFVKEDGRWQLDLLSMARDAAPMLARHISKTGQTEDEFIEDYVADRSGSPFDPAAWDPVVPEETPVPSR